MTSDDPETGASGRREVIVPDRVYRAITVFSTLFAMIAVVGGFMLLDRATNRSTAQVGDINILQALLALLIMIIGAIVYVYGTRFQAEGMEKDKEITTEDTNNG
ncbi:MAG: hypothetical protein ABEI06_03755 [Halobacteriaceae archaeon]